MLAELLGSATAAEQVFLRGLITGETRQGALEGVLLPAIAAAFGVGVDAVRRAAMFAGSIPMVAVAAQAGGAQALAAITLQVGRPVLPMLASSAPTVAAAMARFGAGTPVAVEAKLDGIRIQVHRDGDRIAVYSRSLDDITARLPGVVAAVAALPARRLVLDGEALGAAPGRASDAVPGHRFDAGAAEPVLLRPAARRRPRPGGRADRPSGRLGWPRLVPPELLVRRLVTADPHECRGVLAGRAGDRT